MSAADDRSLALGCLLGSFDGTVVPDWLLALIGDGLGGVVLFAQNVIDDDHVTAMCSLLRDAGPDLVITIDEEGGDVTRLDAGTGSDMPCPAAFGAADDVAATRTSFAALGHRLHRLGIDMTLAPCADINSDPRNPIVGVRAFGSTATLVDRHVAASIAGIHDGGALACAKHFPGHGDTLADTHHGAARVNGSLAELTDRELQPFAAAIAAGTDAILTAHLVAPALDDSPVSLSRPWMQHLRDAMDFTGVIVTDALDMGAVSAGRGADGVAEPAVAALAAGADLLCLGSNFTAPTTEAAITAIVAALVDGRLDRAALAASVRRNRSLHRRTDRPIDLSAAHVERDGSAAWNRVARAAITIDGPLPPGPFDVVECRPPANLPSSNVRWGIAEHLALLDWPVTLVEADHPDLFEPPAGPLLIVIRDGAVHPWQLRLIDRCAAASAPVVVAELGWPATASDLPAGITTIVSHGAARASALAVVEALTPVRRKDG